MKYISVIVPVYYGRKYVKEIIRQIEDCSRQLSGSCYEESLELILVNDAPDEIIPLYSSSLIQISVYHTEKNRGIHGARVFGFGKSRGEYILFLDQDDKIRPDYFVSQLDQIGNHDAVVCRLIHDNKCFYNHNFPFEQMITKDYMLDYGSIIISPGQVLIRRSAIPKVWVKNIVKNNGADDFMLWLCMVKREDAFALNNDILFEHVVNHENASGNSVTMTKSEREIVNVIKENRIYEGDDAARLERMLETVMENRLVFLDKFHKMFYILDAWMELKSQGKDLSAVLNQKGFSSVAVYGMNQIARHLLTELENSLVSVRYVIDRNSEYIDMDIPVYSPDQNPEKVDAVIIALVQGEKQIKEMLAERMQTTVITISEIISCAKEQQK